MRTCYPVTRCGSAEGAIRQNEMEVERRDAPDAKEEQRSLEGDTPFVRSASVSWHRHSCRWWDRHSCLSLFPEINVRLRKGQECPSTQPHITGRNARATECFRRCRADASAEADPTQNFAVLPLRLCVSAFNSNQRALHAS